MIRGRTVVVAFLAGGLAIGAAINAGVRAQTPPAPTEVCAVYVNTDDVEVPISGDTRYDAQAEVLVPVPPGAVGIDSWQLGAEMAPGTKVRAVLFIRSGGPLGHFATREAAQSDLIRPGAPMEISEGQVKLRANFFNEHPTGDVQIARGNLWVYFLMADTY